MNVAECENCGAVAEVYIDDPKFPQSFRLKMRGNFPEKCRFRDDNLIVDDPERWACRDLDKAVVLLLDRLKK